MRRGRTLGLHLATGVPLSVLRRGRTPCSQARRAAACAGPQEVTPGRVLIVLPIRCLSARDGGRCADAQVVEESTSGFCTRARIRVMRYFRWEVVAGQEGKVEGRWWPVIAQ
ncbi:hypothetical protein JB92DRAFT_2825621 [Gautieria morchelliformis]|nr:hypothetical protein JB92DRAFT_2825621 [Gautieria morchelliformis]